MRYTDNIIGRFVYGSQNYGLSGSSSDVDTITLVREAAMPHREEATANGKNKIYTITYFISRLKKGDLECYEILFTQLKNINPKYLDMWNLFVEEFSLVMNYDRIIRALYLKLNEHLCHIFWILKNDGSKYNKKRLYWALRVANQIEQLEHGIDFSTSLIYNNNEIDILNIKSKQNYLSNREVSNYYHLLNDKLNDWPTFNTIITAKEEDCFAKLYERIQGGK